MITDLIGNTVDPDEPPPRRVVSLVPSVTESLFDIGAGGSVAGVTRFCIFPAERVEALPKVGGTKNPDIEAIRALEPDLVYMNLEENLRRDAEAIGAFTKLFVTEPKSIGDVVSLIGSLGAIHHVPDRAARWCYAIREEIERTESRESFTFACAIWKRPWMWCGGDTYVSSLVEAAGGRNVLRDELRYPSHEPALVAALTPDIVFLPDEPYAFTTADADEMRSVGEWNVIGPFPGHLFTWHGTRTLHGLEFLSEVLASR
ncbi:MAG: helical backbone metal receptor [Thermoanaerobaculia bacterium]